MVEINATISDIIVEIIAIHNFSLYLHFNQYMLSFCIISLLESMNEMNVIEKELETLKVREDKKTKKERK
jgi:hypothetical protein